MKYCSVFALFALLVAGCAAGASGSDEGTESEENVDSAQEELTGWLGPISEEAGTNNKHFGTANIAATAAYCGGSYCDNNWLYGSALPWYAHTGTEVPTGSFISEEAPNNATFCVNGAGYINGVVTGLAASGKYSDNIELLCSPLSFSSGHGWSSCKWTGWFSEEAGYNYFPAGYYATGVQCSGSYCDNLRYYVCNFY